MMKKGLAILLAILLLVSVGTVLGFAGGNRNGAPATAGNAASTCPVTTVTGNSATTTAGKGYRYTDTNDDGLCDNAGNGNANGRGYHQQQNGAGHCAKGRTGSSCQANRK